MHRLRSVRYRLKKNPTREKRYIIFHRFDVVSLAEGPRVSKVVPDCKLNGSKHEIEIVSSDMSLDRCFCRSLAVHPRVQSSRFKGVERRRRRRWR